MTDAPARSPRDVLDELLPAGAPVVVTPKIPRPRKPREPGAHRPERLRS